MLLFLDEVAARLRVNYSTARELVLSGKLQGIRLGGRRRIQVDECDLAAFIEASRIGPDPGPITPAEPPKTAHFHRGHKRTNGWPVEWRERFARKA